MLKQAWATKHKMKSKGLQHRFLLRICYIYVKRLLKTLDSKALEAQPKIGIVLEAATVFCSAAGVCLRKYISSMILDSFSHICWTFAAV